MLRKHVPDLDALESPLISASPFGSIIDTMPGSALAERIFNDPNAWEGTEAALNSDLGDAKDAMAWLEGEVEKYHASGDELGLSPIERLSGVFQMDDFSSSRLPILRSSSTSSSDKTSGHNVRIKLPCTLDLVEETENRASPPGSSGVLVTSSSTWTILELYGLPSDTPRYRPKRTSILSSCFPSPTIRPVPPLPSSFLITSSTHSPPSTPTPLPRLPKNSAFPPSPEGQIRKLPVIPDLVADSNVASPQPVLLSLLCDEATEGTVAHSLPSNFHPITQSPIGHRRSASNNITRSPPAGPRPRSAGSNNNSTRQRQSAVSPFMIRTPRSRPTPSPLPLPPIDVH